MANNYTLSSSFLQLEETELEKAKTIVPRLESELEPDENGDVDSFSEYLAWEDDGLWIRHTESISLEAVVAVIQVLLDELEIDEPFEFSWAYTCSAPRIDEFGGGACSLQRGKAPIWVDALTEVHRRRFMATMEEDISRGMSETGEPKPTENHGL